MMPKIAFITELFAPHVGGQEYRFLRLARLLSNSWEVYVYTIRHQKELPEYEKLGDIYVYRYITLSNYVKPGSRNFFPLIKYVAKTEELLRMMREEFDLLLVNEMPIVHLYFIPKYENLIVDFCEIHGKGLLRILTSNAVKRFKFAIAVSDFIRDSLKNWSKTTRVESIRTPIDISEYYANPDNKDPYTILYVGRLVKHKNILNLIKAVIRLNETNGSVKWRLIVTGDGPKDMKLLINEISRKYKFIEYLGYVSEDTKKELYRKAWLFALPSTREGFPNAIAEAIVSNTPVLVVKSPNSGVWYEVVKHGLGMVCNDATPESLAKCISGIDETKYYDFIDGCKKLRTEFDSSYIRERLMNFLKEVINYEKTEGII